ncbi:drug:h+ antiporter [Gymnopus androsaceus JB14]|uniref:Drug:h+ antiporter n=1 Tax=Gymnopus androsaceus JB14 TaxID=1447944 RepID=A0A6A4HPB3_9AGAR|nr:drug:h+ antiporter [Gymnopus androsaceus JB14]
MASPTDQLPHLDNEHENSSASEYNEKNGQEQVVVVGKAQTEGLVKVEAAQRVWGPRSKIAFWVGVALISYVYSLDGETTYTYQAYATSSFNQHSLLGAVSTAQAIILACMKPVAAKIADTFGRAEAFTFLVFFYCLGYILLASCSNISTYAAGGILYYVGYSCLEILIQIIIGDVTNLRWRSLLSSMYSLPFLVNWAVASNISADVLAQSGWRWGYGMFAIIVPAAIAPITITLYWAQNRAKKLGVVATNIADEVDAPRIVSDKPFLTRFWLFLIDMDALGLLIFAAGWACLLVPLTLVNGSYTTWSSGNVIAMLVCGGVILIAFIPYEARFAKVPVFPLAFFKNPTILFSAFIGFFDFVSFYLQYTYQYSFIYVTRDWTVVNQNYFAYTQTLALTIFGILAGFVQAYTRRTKWLLTIGLCIRLLGVGLMIKSKGAHGTTGFLVICQVLQGLGGGIAACSSQLLAQGSVRHQDLGTATAFVLLWAAIGNAVGSALAAAIWRDYMPKQLTQNLNGLVNSTEINDIYSSITTAITYRDETAIYDGIITSYDYTMKILLIVATVIAVIPVILSLFVKDMYLSDKHNDVEDVDNSGAPTDVEKA